MDQVKQLVKKIQEYFGRIGQTDKNHWDNIVNYCRSLARTLRLIAECCGPRTPEADAALAVALKIFAIGAKRCNDPNLRPPGEGFRGPNDPTPLCRYHRPC